MPPTRRQLKALGSLQLVGYANNPTRVITELAFIADAQVNDLGNNQERDVDEPLEVRFDEFMDGVNSRGRGTKTRQRKMTVEQAAAVLLVTVQKGHVELIVKQNDPHIIDVIRVLPGAKRVLAAFLPKLRGYGDIPYDQQYRGAIALAKRHFFPNGKPPTKKELMALLLQSYQEKKALSRRALGVQTSMNTLDGSSAETAIGNTGIDSAAFTNDVDVFTESSDQSEHKFPNNEIVVDVERTLVTPEVDPTPDNHSLPADDEVDPIQLLTRTPAALRNQIPYMTPVSNPRYMNQAMDTPSSPTIASGGHSDVILDIDSAMDEGIGGLEQAVAVSQGGWNYYYDKFVEACRKIKFLEKEKVEMQRKLDTAKKLIDDTDRSLQKAKAENVRLGEWGNGLFRQLEQARKQLSPLMAMLTPKAFGEVH